MVLTIDCFKLVRGVGKSIGIYNVAVSVVNGLAKYIIDNNTGDVIKVIGNSYNRGDFDIEGVVFYEITKLNPLKKIDFVLWELLFVNKTLRELGTDVVLFPRGFAPLKCSVKDVILIHDMIPFYYDEEFPGFFNRVENFYIKMRLKASAKEADRIVTISEASKSDIIKYTSVNEDKIHLIYNSCDFGSNTEKMNEEPYICAITSSLPHKNAKGIIQAYSRYCEISNKPIKLKIIGISDCEKYGADKKLSDRIECFNYIADKKEMIDMLSNASVFLFLSLKEGFGLPPLEAMSVGTPVVCSNLSSMPEIVADAGVLVSPTDYDSIAKALERVINDDVTREQLIINGYENCRRFDHDSASEKYYEVMVY